MSADIKNVDCSISESNCNDSKQTPKFHRLVVTTFSGPTYCDHCDKFLWGLIKQGLTCQTCGYVCHPSCVKKVSKGTCLNRANDFKYETLIDSSPKKSSKLTAEKKVGKGLGLDSEQKQVIHKLMNGDVQSQPVTQTASTTVTVKKSDDKTIYPKIPEIFIDSEGTETAEETDDNIESIESSNKTKKHKKKKSLSQTHKELISTLRRTANIDTPHDKSESEAISSTPQPSPKTTFDSFLRDVINSTKEKERQLAQMRNAPALHIISTTLPNFTQFITRIDIIRESSEFAISIFTWEYPIRSWFFMFCFINICFRPEWLIFIPFIGLWLNILGEYFAELNKNSIEPREESSSNIDNSKDSIFILNSEKFYSGILGSEVTSAREVATKYSQNLQFVQNLMGWYVESYNLTLKYWDKMKVYLGPNWPLWLTAQIIPTALIVHWYFPKRYLLLIGVCLALLANHPFFMALSGHLASYLSDEFGPHFSSVTQALKVRVLERSQLKNGKGPITISVFENQRWWAIIGWNERTLTTERDSWSDENGKTKQLPIFLQHPESGYVWEENSEWKVVHDWCQPINTDAKGWVYYDNHWKGPSSKPRIDGFTRRRLWTRKMVPQSTAPSSPLIETHD